MRINPALNGRLTLVAQGTVASPDVSGNGEVVVYNEFAEGTTSVYRVEGEDRVLLSEDGHMSMHAVVSEDGSRVAYTRYSNAESSKGGNWDIVLWDQGERQFLAQGPGNEMGPEISGDGRVVVWDDDVDGRLGQNNIVKWEEGETTVLVDSPALDIFPAISEDGSRIVFRRYQEGKASLWLQDQNGTVKPFLEGEGHLLGPQLSADGRTLCYVDKSDGELDLMHHDEGHRRTRAVSADPQIREMTPDMSADGQTIVWTGMDFGKGAPAQTNIYLEKDGQVLKVTESDGGMNTQPRVSDDGKTLVWTWTSSKDLSDQKIYKLDLE